MRGRQLAYERAESANRFDRARGGSSRRRCHGSVAFFTALSSSFDRTLLVLELVLSNERPCWL